MEELRELVALAVPAASRVLAVAPDPSLLKALSGRGCRTWSLVADDSPALPLTPLSEGVAVCDMDRLGGADPFPGLEFDAVVLMGALAHVAFPAEFLQRVTKPLTTGGRLVASVPNATSFARRLRAWEGLGQDEEVGPGWPLRRAFTAPAVERLMNESGLFTVETLRLRSRPPEPELKQASLPPAVLSFLNADEDAGTDHYVVIASPAVGHGVEPVSVAEEMQRRLHAAEDDLAERRQELATLAAELEALQLDLALRDDFALELRGQVQTVEGRAARLEAELADARASLDGARQRLAEQEGELEDLRRLTGRGLRALLLDRLIRRWDRPR